MPIQDGPGELLCENLTCQKLWNTEWPKMRQAFASFEEMKVLECEVCKRNRADRCRVRQSDKNDTRHAEPPFSEAPYVVPYNMPKYFAQQLRALQFAQNAQPPQQLLWIVARDVPFLGDIKQLKGRTAFDPPHILKKYDKLNFLDIFEKKYQTLLNFFKKNLSSFLFFFFCANTLASALATAIELSLA